MSRRQERIRQLEDSQDMKLAELRGRVLTLKIQKETALEEVNRMQRFLIQQDREIEDVTQEIEDVQEHYQSRLRRERELERREIDRRLNTLGRGRALTSSQSVNDNVSIVLRAPPTTPSIRCFMVHPFNVEAHNVNECHFFLALSNEGRVALLIKQHRCFGCFWPSSVVGHEVGDCPQSKWCDRCRSHEHHQILCGSRRLYGSLLAVEGSLVDS
jgi:hypothetical protein